MNRSLKTIGYLALGVLLLSQFNNCAQTEQPVTSYTADGSSVSCAGPSCVQPNDAWIKIKANLAGDFGVHAALTEFNLGGDCNEGAYPDNDVSWTLMLNGTPVRNSTMSGLAGGGPALSKCVNGRFMVYLNLAAIPSDNVNRTGLRTGVGTARATYSLRMNITSKDGLGVAHTNSTFGLHNIFLVPL